MADKYLALLRGINVGGKNMLPMKDLAAMFSKAGCTQIQTYIQSGNVIFSVADEIATTICPKIEKQIPFQTTIIFYCYCKRTKTNSKVTFTIKIYENISYIVCAVSKS